MIDLLEKKLKEGERIAIGYHHTALDNTVLDNLGIECYQQGFNECKRLVLEELNRVVKDETLKGLLQEKIEAVEDKFSYRDK